MLQRLRPKPKTRTNPVFYPDQLKTLLSHDPGRLEAVFAARESVDLLTWNVFESLDSDADRPYLAGLLQPLAGSDLAAPLRILLWTGRHREPLLRPSAGYLRHVRERAGGGDDEAITEFLRPVEVPVRIEAPGIVALVETTLSGVPVGAGGRDRLVELVDTGLEHARNLSKALTIGVVYPSGTAAASDLSARINRLRRPEALAAALPWRGRLPEVRFRELSWQQLIATWERERDSLELFGQPVRAFLARCQELGLR